MISLTMNCKLGLIYVITWSSEIDLFKTCDL